MDLWNLFLQRAFGVPSLDYCFLGRWVLHLADGRFAHASIAAAPPRALECPMGYLAHYSIGVGLSAAFVRLVSPAWLARPTFLPALLFGIATLVFPLFVLQPALGLGVASARAAHPTRARLKSLASHLVFGIGLYACALALGLALGR